MRDAFRVSRLYSPLFVRIADCEIRKRETAEDAESAGEEFGIVDCRLRSWERRGTAEDAESAEVGRGSERGGRFGRGHVI